MPDTKKTQSSPFIFGEVLFDCFPDGRKIAGGAPFNVAWHLTGFNVHPRFISRIGTDDAGERIMDLMQRWQMNTELVQQDSTHSTGTVQVSLHQGQPSFDIVDKQAYDFIDYVSIANTVSVDAIPLLYCGSLIRRNPVSRQSLDKLIQHSIPLFVDINLRNPWWQHEDAIALLNQATWVKLNQDELAVLTGATADEHNIRDLAIAFRQQHQIDLLVVTLGEKGAFIIDAQQLYHRPPPSVTELADTVGAGDAFSSVILTGLLNAWPVDTMLERALQFAALICAQPGATAFNHKLYDQLKTEWKLDDT